MNENTNVVESGGDLTKLKADIKTGIDKIINLEKKRAGVNADIAAVRKKLVAAGINRHALAAVLAYKKMDEPQREGFDEGYLISRESIGLPVQGAFDFPVQAQANGEDATKVEPGFTAQLGREAGKAGKFATDNPELGPAARKVWYAGWQEGQAEIAKDMKPKPKKTGRRKGAGGSAPTA